MKTLKSYLLKNQLPNKYIFIFGFVLLSSSCIIAQATYTLSNTSIKGTMVVDSTTVTRDTLKAQGDILASQDVKILGDIEVAGKIAFSSNTGISYKSPTPTRNYTNLIFGSPAPPPSYPCNIDPEMIPACFMVNNSNGQFSMGTQPQNNIFNGLIRSYNINGSANSMLTMGNTGWGASMIESEGNANCNPQGAGLLINYFCGRNTYINTGNASVGANPTPGGKVFVGEFLSGTKHVEIGIPSAPIWDGNNIALDIFMNAGKGIKFTTNNNGAALISIANINNATSSPFTLFGEGNIEMNSSSAAKKMIVIKDPLATTASTERFTVFADGTTYIGVKRPSASGLHSSAKLSVDGRLLAKEIYVNIHNSVWADYVFDKNYKLMPLSEVETFIKTNKHLPNVPSSSELTSTDEYNLNLSDMQKIQMEKIEELYLHLIQQDKAIKALQLENETLKALINKK